MYHATVACHPLTGSTLIRHGFFGGRYIFEISVFASELVECCFKRWAPIFVIKLDFHKWYRSGEYHKLDRWHTHPRSRRRLYWTPQPPPLQLQGLKWRTTKTYRCTKYCGWILWRTHHQRRRRSQSNHQWTSPPPLLKWPKWRTSDDLREKLQLSPVDWGLVVHPVNEVCGGGGGRQSTYIGGWWWTIPRSPLGLVLGLGPASARRFQE